MPLPEPAAGCVRAGSARLGLREATDLAVAPAVDGWEVRRGGCTDTDPAGSVRKCNRQNQQLTTEYGQYVHTLLPTNDEPVPFDPKFDTYEVSNGFVARPGAVTYAVPNLSDTLLSTDGPDGERERWYVKNVVRLWQSDWLWALLLREIGTDVHGLVD